MKKKKESALIKDVASKIHFIRGKRVMLDRDLAELYEVETKLFNRAVKRNIERFPDDFMFQVTKEEYENLRCQFGTSSWGGRRYFPYVFTQEGVAMLSGVLNSKRAVAVNIQIMRAFVEMREMLSNYAGLKRKIDGIEKKYDAQFKVVFEAIRELMAPSKQKLRKIGFQREKAKKLDAEGR